ncbi:helix-turn-helix domain-containing protein [Rothia terrae]|uniref:helix-turn-helix domain-containing protein n=1 Tax=Rothia terrae TaxID=396015 RepID=UPI0014450DEE|nr:helix-turn-helix domain-containing protein [Rothia terrae]NKZ33700.1 helix-turn-helix domain-containing protein [Rothia terrae]
MSDNNLLSIEQVAAALGIDESAVKSLLDEGKLSPAGGGEDGLKFSPEALGALKDSGFGGDTLRGALNGTDLI